MGDCIVIYFNVREFLEIRCKNALIIRASFKLEIILEYVEVTDSGDGLFQYLL